MESVGIGSLDWTWGHFRSLPASLELQGLQMFAFLLNPIVPRGTEQSRTDSWDAALLLYTLLVIYIPDERRKHRNFRLRSAEMDWAKQNSFITTLEMLLQPNVGLSWRGIHYHLFVIFFLCMCVCDPGVQFHRRVFSLYIYQHSPHFTVVYGNSYLLLNVQW